MSKTRRAASTLRPRCLDCKSLFTPADDGGQRCACCVGQLVIPFPRLRDARGRFVAGGGR